MDVEDYFMPYFDLLPRFVFRNCLLKRSCRRVIFGFQINLGMWGLFIKPISPLAAPQKYISTIRKVVVSAKFNSNWSKMIRVYHYKWRHDRVWHADLLCSCCNRTFQNQKEWSQVTKKELYTMWKSYPLKYLPIDKWAFPSWMISNQ
jgi:hypothetical protein